MRLIPLKTEEDVGLWSAYYIADKINRFSPTEEEPFVLGLPTGSSCLNTYKNLIKLYQQNYVSFKNVVTFNMDEYLNIPPHHPCSYRTFMFSHFFNHIDIQEKNINLLSSEPRDIDQECINYEEKIKQYGQIHLFLGGVGNDGHIAFNEPTSSLSSRTRIKTLTEETRAVNSRFFNHIDEVPTHVLTIGVGTLLEASEIMILAMGNAKALAVAAAVEGPITHQWTVSALQMHPKSMIVCDHHAVMELKVKTLHYFHNLEKDNTQVLDI